MTRSRDDRSDYARGYEDGFWAGEQAEKRRQLSAEIDVLLASYDAERRELGLPERAAR